MFLCRACRNDYLKFIQYSPITDIHIYRKKKKNNSLHFTSLQMLPEFRCIKTKSKCKKIKWN